LFSDTKSGEQGTEEGIVERLSCRRHSFGRGVINWLFRLKMNKSIGHGARGEREIRLTTKRWMV